MNFLPFIFTFLLLLSLTGSFLFSSATKITRATQLSLLQHRAYLKLCSQQSEKEFKKFRKPKSGRENKAPSGNKQTSKKQKKEPRTRRDGCDGRKLNLSDMIQENNQELQHSLEQIAVRLIELLYGSCSFYQENAAYKIVHKMVKAKIHSLEELKFDDTQLDQIYYKMLQGTSTGYPPLSEYIYFSNGPKPILFRYATQPLIQAAVGDVCAATIFDSEKQLYQQNPHKQVLSKEKFLSLMKDNHASLVPQSLIGTIFDFEIVKKGPHQIQQKGKISAVHSSK